MSPRAFVVRVWISSRLLSSPECLLYDEREERYTRAAEIVPAVAGPLSESIFASLGTYFRAYLHAFDNAGAHVGPMGPAHDAPGHIRQKSSRDSLAFLLDGCHRDLFLYRTIGFVEECYANEREKLWMAFIYRWSETVIAILSSWDSLSFFPQAW